MGAAEDWAEPKFGAFPLLLCGAAGRGHGPGRGHAELWLSCGAGGISGVGNPHPVDFWG